MKKHEKITRMLPAGHGHWMVWIERYGKEMSGVVTDMEIIDTYRSIGKSRGWKSAGNRLYNIVVTHNK